MTSTANANDAGEIVCVLQARGSNTELLRNRGKRITLLLHIARGSRVRCTPREKCSGRRLRFEMPAHTIARSSAISAWRRRSQLTRFLRIRNKAGLDKDRRNSPGDLSTTKPG